MKKEILLTSLRISASFLSGVFLVLAYPDYDVSWLAWIALVPLMLAILGATPKQGFFLCFVFSAVLLTGVCRWSFEVSRYTFLHHFLGNLVLGFPVSIFGWAFALISSRRGATLALSTAPFIWVSLEYVRSNLSFLSLPWTLLSHSQYQTLSVIQISSVTGAYGVSFLVLLVNASLSAAILAWVRGLKIIEIPPSHRLSQKGTVFILVTTAALTGLVLLHGKMNLSRPIEGKSLKLSVVQGNIEQTKKWDRRYRSYILERYEELSREASGDQPRLVIWPEAATPGFLLNDRALLKRVTGLVREMNTYFLIGS
jgi:apolipoprotein N-acyltransferase